MMENNGQAKPVSVCTGDVNQNFLNGSCTNLPLYMQSFSKKASPHAAWAFPGFPNPVVPFLSAGQNQMRTSSGVSSINMKLTPNGDQQQPDFIRRNSSSAIFQASPAALAILPDVPHPRGPLQQYDLFMSSMENLQAAAMFHRQQLSDRNKSDLSRSFLNNGAVASPSKICQFPANLLPGSLGSPDGPYFNLSLPGLPENSASSSVPPTCSNALRFLDMASYSPQVSLSPKGGAIQDNQLQQQKVAARAAFAAAQMNSYFSFLRQGALRMPEIPRGGLTQQGLTPFEFDHHVYQAALAATGNTYHMGSTPTKDQTEKHLPYYPHQSAGLGLNFVTQTSQFVTGHVGNTQSSEESSNVSSISPGRQSPLLVSVGQRSPASPQSDKVVAPKHRAEHAQNHCPHCGKMFSSSSALAKHKLIHSDERKYVCKVCQRGFKRQDHLNGHMITHRDKKPYECSHRDCGKSYCDMRSLRRHLESQHGSPLGGTTPGSISTLMSLYPDCGASLKCASNNHVHECGAGNLSIPEEIPRPSSAPSAQDLGHQRPLPRRRRSSSVEESSLSSDFGRGYDRKSLFVSRVSRTPRERGISESSVASQGPSAVPPDQVYEMGRSPSSITKTLSSPDDDRTEGSQNAGESGARMMLAHQTPADLGMSKKCHNSGLSDASRPAFSNKMYGSVSDSSHLKSKSDTESVSWGATLNQLTPSPSQPNMPFLLSIKNPYTYPPSSLFGTSQVQAPLPYGYGAGWHPTASSSSCSNSSSSSSSSGSALSCVSSIRGANSNSDFAKLTTASHSVQEKRSLFRAPASEVLRPEQGALRSFSSVMAEGVAMPTNATAIAVAAAKDHGLSRTSFFSGGSNHDGFYGIHPSSAQWQNVVQEDPVKADKEPHVSHYQISQREHGKNGPLASSEKGGVLKSEREERDIIAEPFKLSDRVRRTPDSIPRFNPSPNREARYPELSRAFELSRPIERALLQDGDRYSELPREPVLFQEHFSRFDRLPPANDPPPLISRIPSLPPVLGKFKGDSFRAPMTEPPRICVDSPYENFAPSPPSPNKKPRPRPGPIIIPPAVSTNLSFNVTGALSKTSLEMAAKDIYTPPPMLSPRSRFFLPPGTTPRGTMPPTPSRLLLGGRRLSSLSDAPLPSSEEHPVLPFPEPKINIGPMFQAELPNLVARDEAQKDIHRASLMWSPLKDDSQKDDELQSYLEMACSLALYGGSNNKEYAFHILQRTRGNIKEAVRLLLSRRHILRADDPNADYHYSGSIRWSSKERLAFRQAYRTKGKLFTVIQQEVSTKSVHQCVEFYYLWKAMHPESFRARTRIVEVESEQEEEDVPPTPTAAVAPLSTIREPVFECNYPDCRARFVSRQALNGHIRVHGGSMAKPNEIRRPKLPKPAVYNAVLPEGDSPAPFLGPPSAKKRKAPPTSIIVAADGTQQLQFQCKVCGRVFNKVKSRSAHMKTHVKKEDSQKPKVPPVMEALELFSHG